MSVLPARSMTLSHDPATASGWLNLILRWHDRAKERAQLASLSDLELQDFGQARGTIMSEVEKPFWRA